MNTQMIQPRIADYVRPLIARWWLILIAVVVATGAVYAFYSHKPNVYTTSSLVYYQDPGDVVDGTPSQPQTDRTVLDAATLLDSRATALLVSKQIGYSGSPEALLKQVSIGSRSGSDFISIASNAHSANEAAAITNGFAAQLVASLNNGVRYQIQNALKTSKTQLAQTPGGAAGAAQRADLIDQIDRLQLSLKVPTLVAKQVEPAVAPGVPSSPKPKRDALFAFIISLVAAIAVCYGLERFDRRLKTPDDMERAYGRPLLSVLPHTADPVPQRKGEPALGSDFREPFRTLRTNIELESLDASMRTIVVSSALPGEGKSTLVRNLALAYCEAGRRVIVVDLDLRNPRLPQMFGVPKLGGRQQGMTEVLRHEATVAEAALVLPVAVRPLDATLHSLERRNGSNGSKGSNGTNGSGPHAELAVLPSGSRPANAPAVLASDRLIEVLDELKEHYDVVVIDSAPLLAVTDTVPLLRYADGALFVGRLDVTTRDTAKRLMQFLERVPQLRLLGVVANDLSRLEASGYGYGYGYGYGAYREELPDDRRSRFAGRFGRPKQPV